MCEVPRDHKWAKDHASPISGRGQTAEDVLKAFSVELLPHLQGRLNQDPRFVNWGDQWWLAKAVQPIPRRSWINSIHCSVPESPNHLQRLLAYLGGHWPDTPGNRFSLNRALLATSDRFKNMGTETDSGKRFFRPRISIGRWPASRFECAPSGSGLNGPTLCRSACPRNCATIPR